MWSADDDTLISLITVKYSITVQGGLKKIAVHVKLENVQNVPDYIYFFTLSTNIMLLTVSLTCMNYPWLNKQIDQSINDVKISFINQLEKYIPCFIQKSTEH